MQAYGMRSMPRVRKSSEEEFGGRARRKSSEEKLGGKARRKSRATKPESAY
jgi:hypothetical protein